MQTKASFYKKKKITKSTTFKIYELRTSTCSTGASRQKRITNFDEDGLKRLDQNLLIK